MNTNLLAEVPHLPTLIVIFVALLLSLVGLGCWRGWRNYQCDKIQNRLLDQLGKLIPPIGRKPSTPELVLYLDTIVNDEGEQVGEQILIWATISERDNVGFDERPVHPRYEVNIFVNQELRDGSVFHEAAQKVADAYHDSSRAVVKFAGAAELRPPVRAEPMFRDDTGFQAG